MKRKLFATLTAIFVALTFLVSCKEQLNIKPVEKDAQTVEEKNEEKEEEKKEENKEEEKEEEEEKTVVLVDTESQYYIVYLFIIDDYYSGEDMKLSAYMKAVSDAGKFSYETVDSQFGAYLTSVNGKTAGSSEFWSPYTSNENYAGEWGEPYVYNEVTLYSASLGIDSLPVKTGETIMFMLMSY